MQHFMQSQKNKVNVDQNTTPLVFAVDKSTVTPCEHQR